MPKGVQGVFMDYWIKTIIMTHYQTFMFTHCDHLHHKKDFK